MESGQWLAHAATITLASIHGNPPAVVATIRRLNQHASRQRSVASTLFSRQRHQARAGCFAVVGR
ncbi:uncharacterized protein CLUP02_08106 [Colletotrichum lupini]|uniref:Uncharacterized protein n=1 Tax=Colletotrichum lupini TaxID=145971 RepID=A0A9Q8STP3_9PEZI|nr:uncharacterized protein CLUP02_08106 [Colletotrichum lupini]UQC82616.1 hypothetical protein CLUP02_08106 [Colletotrichum lupini]